MSETIVVTGADGRIGSMLVRKAKQRHGRVIGLGRDIPLDAPNADRDLRDLEPTVIIHAAAYTDVDGCEADSYRAFRSNVLATTHAAFAADLVGAKLVLLSTDYVFSGNEGPYDEQATPNPQSVYGRTKYQAEQVARTFAPHTLIVRTSTPYGPRLGTSHNYASWVVGQLALGNQVSAPTDQISSPTLIEHLADMILALVDAKAEGIYHAAGAEWCDRHYFAVRVAKQFRLDPTLVKQTTTKTLKQLAPRPRHSGLVTDKIAEIIRPLTLDEGLKRMSETWPE